ncbi:MAG: hypothetical protein HY851_09555 [candidate division Zixibacteria bacterium]|nr:hypothetical protein [candidate division Zixibacteria bacterium]
MGRSTFRALLISVIVSWALSLGLSGGARADINWTTLTSLKEVRRLRTINDTIFAATAGGLLVITDPAQPGAIYDNLSSLRATDLTDIIEAADGQKWVAANGRLIKFGGPQADTYPFINIDASLVRLLCLADDGDNLWIGTSIGLVLFSKVNDGGQIQDSYQMFGTLNAAPEVNDILLVGDSIWLATSAGIAVANRTIPNQLKVPSFWTTYGPDNHPELGTSQPRRIALFESNYYIGTSFGLFRLDRAATDTLTELPAGSPPWVTELKIENDSLFYYVPDGLGVIKSGNNTLLGTFGLPIFPVNGTNTGAYRWLALLGETGLYQNSSGSYALYPYTGMPSNLVADVAINSGGVVTGLFTNRQAQTLTDSGWTQRTATVSPLTTGLADQRGNTWVGTWGDGLYRLNADSLFNYDETNSSLRGNNDPGPGPSTVVIRGLATSAQYVFAACYRALNGYPVVFGDLDHLNLLSGWDSLGLSDGISDQYVTSLDVYDSLVAVGTESRGVYTVDLGATPRYKADDTSYHFTTTSGFLISDNVLCVRFSPAGDLWVGTASGASRLLVGYPRFTDVGGIAGFGAVRAIEFDSRGNAWLGSTNGVLRIDAVTGELLLFNARNSGLVNDAVNSIRYDHATGDMYIATDGGISIARSQYGKPTNDVNNVLAFPNPFVIRSSSDIMRFNFAQSATVRILTLAGERVAERDINAGWDGTNDNHKPVASGVYFFVLTSTDGGAIGSGKFLLIREQ